MSEEGAIKVFLGNALMLSHVLRSTCRETVWWILHGENDLTEIAKFDSKNWQRGTLVPSPQKFGLHKS